MTNEELIKEVAKPLLKPIKVLFVLSLLAIFSSPFIFIWDSFVLACKVGFTGLISLIIVNFLWNMVNATVKDAVEKRIKIKKESKFQEKLNKMVEEQKNKNNEN